MHRHQRLTRAAGAAALAALVPFVSACSSAVEVTPAEQADSAGCKAAAAHWPKDVSGKPPVETSSKSDSVRAYGDPTIVARCGVAALGPTSNQCIAVDDVDWVAEPLSDGTRFTAYGRDPSVEVLVPKAYAPEPLMLPVFTPVVKALPSNGRKCT